MSVPRPYESHAPMLGLPASCAPVWKKVMPGSWLMASVCIDLMKVSSSTIFAVCGIRSLTQAPEAPCCRNGKRDGTSGKRSCAAVIVVTRWSPRTDGGRSSPTISARRGL